MPLTRKSIAKIGYSRAYQSYDYFQISNFLQNDTADLTTFAFNTVHFSIIRNNLNYFYPIIYYLKVVSYTIQKLVA